MSAFILADYSNSKIILSNQGLIRTSTRAG